MEEEDKGSDKASADAVSLIKGAGEVLPLSLTDEKFRYVIPDGVDFERIKKLMRDNPEEWIAVPFDGLNPILNDGEEGPKGPPGPPGDELWPCTVVGIDDVPVPAQEEHSPRRILIVADGYHRQSLTAAIAAVLSTRFADDVVQPYPLQDRDMFSYYRDFPVEFRWTDLHYRLSMQSGPEKDKQVQQRRKAHFKFHQQKRVKQGRSHAKQKHKGMARYC